MTAAGAVGAVVLGTDVRIWRGPDGALRVVRSNVPCAGPHPGIAAVKIVRRDGLFQALADVRTSTHAHPRTVKLSLRGVNEDVVAIAASMWLTEVVIGVWDDGSVVAAGGPSERAWRVEMARRQREGLPVWPRAARGAQRAAL